MAVLVWKTIYNPSFFCFPLTHFHILQSFSQLILLCLYIKKKGFTLQISAPPFYQKKLGKVWDQRVISIFNTNVKGDQELWLQLQNWIHTCSASPTCSPVNLFPRFPLMFSQWHLTTDPASHSLSCLQHHWLLFSLPPCLSLCSPLCQLPLKILQSHPLSPYMALHPFLGNHSNILKHLYAANLQVSHFSKLQFQTISNKHFTGTLLYMQAQKKQSLCFNFPSTHHLLLSPACHSLSGSSIIIRQFPQWVLAFCERHASALHSHVKSTALNSTFLGHLV